MKTLHMLDKSIDDEPVCVLLILIPKDKILPFSNCYVLIYNYYKKFTEHLKTCRGTPVAEHWPREVGNRALFLSSWVNNCRVRG
jgi:hypothetical protein